MASPVTSPQAPMLQRTLDPLHSPHHVFMQLCGHFAHFFSQLLACSAADSLLFCQKSKEKAKNHSFCRPKQEWREWGSELRGNPHAILIEEIPNVPYPTFYSCVYACFLFQDACFFVQERKAGRKTDRFRQSQKKGWMHGGWMMDEGREAERERGSDGWRDGVMYVCWYAWILWFMHPFQRNDVHKGGLGLGLGLGMCVCVWLHNPFHDRGRGHKNFEEIYTRRWHQGDQLCVCGCVCVCVFVCVCVCLCLSVCLVRALKLISNHHTSCRMIIIFDNIT